MLRLQWRHHHPVTQRRCHADCFGTAHCNAASSAGCALQSASGTVHSAGRTYAAKIR